tara:strand:+ start:1710 stop:2165 length:456 start_codon:yes stop_codon:yes gene_type:complete
MVETSYITWLYMIASIAILVGILTDLRSGLIPYVVTIPLLICALIIAVLNSTLLIAIGLGTLSFLLLWILAMLTGHNCWNRGDCEECISIGGGDIKFSTGIAVLIASPIGILVFLAVSYVSATFFSLISDVKKIKMAPWLALGCSVALWAF